MFLTASSVVKKFSKEAPFPSAEVLCGVPVEMYTMFWPISTLYTLGTAASE